MKNFKSVSFFVSMLVLVLFGTGCASRPTANGGKFWGNQWLNFTIPPAYSVTIVNNAAPFLQVENGAVVVNSKLAMGESQVIPFRLFEGDQFAIVVKGYKMGPNGERQYIGTASYAIYLSGQPAGRSESIVVNYLQRPQVSY